MPISTTSKLSVAKLFIDQLIPSGGISGTLVFARALARQGVARNVVMAAVVVGTVSYHGAYVVSLAAALAILVIEGRATRLIVVTSALFSLVAIAVAIAAVALSGRKTTGFLGKVARIPLVKEAVGLVQDADPSLVRSPRLIVLASLYQFAIVALDVGTMWLLIRSLGARASTPGVYASFMISSLFRTVGVVPDGLGTVEAASIVTLRMANVSLAAALAATLLFRGLSFWLPLVPGLLFSRHAMSGQAQRRSDVSGGCRSARTQ
jgi:Mg2+-importing ATPase